MLRRASLSIALFLSIGFAGQALAAQEGLGSRWPDAADVSSSPYWHVYVFRQSGVTYIQVNDLNGTVRQAVAAVGDQVLVLPMGVDASHAAISRQPAPSSRPSQVVYHDDSVSVTVEADAHGNLQWRNALLGPSCGPPECVRASQL